MAVKFDDLELGAAFGGSLTVTEAHVVLAAGLFGDFAPLHVNAVAAEASRFGARLAHGTLVAGIAAAEIARYFGANAGGYLEQHLRFVGPVFIGDTITSRWTVVDKLPKEKFRGGIVEVELRCATQTEVVAMEGSSKLIVTNE